jgi:RND family efflux transporter MFP subunit
MEVDANTRLYTIADLSHVWVYADIYEYELPWIEAGQRAIVELSYLPGKEFESEVTYVYPVLDPETRTARVRLELLNPGLILKPDMLANVTLQAQPRADVLSIPDAAVLRSGRRSLVFVATGGGHFEPRPVELGVDTGEGWIEIREGLREGERVVTSGQFLIDSESRLRETVQKMLAPTQAKE